ncbi:MAG: hypothetical protein RJA99_3180 [Pseudomonadota bacterium]|jgi:hypothetical protein
MPLVSTGQITIVDTNDARSITLALTANGGTQQVYTKDESTISYTPSWASSALVITPQISIGGLNNAQAWAALVNKQFALTAGGTALTTGSTSTSFVNNSDVQVNNPFTVSHAANGSSTASTISIAGNLKDSVASLALFFDADFVDPVTSLTTHITAQITLNTVKTGTNAVYITTRGQTNIEQATGSTKNNVAITADLVRSSGVDTSGLTYRWYDGNASTQISTSTSSFATKYGMKTTATGVTPTASGSDLGVNVPASGSGNAFNTLVINESAIANIGVFRVDITDSDSKTYSQYFTVYDISDLYTTQVQSTSGDKLQNGQGSTALSPRVFYGPTEVTNLTGWSFTWYLYDRNGKRGGFVDTARISTAGGAAISANTTGTSATITYGGTSYAFAAGDIVKAVKPDGTAFFYEVASSTTNVVTIRTPSTNTWLNFTDFPAPSSASDFVGGKLYGCTANGGTRTTSAGASITVTGDEVDVKARILCEANRP